MATHSSILAWRIPRTEEPGCSPRGHKEADTTELLTHGVSPSPASWGQWGKTKTRLHLVCTLRSPPVVRGCLKWPVSSVFLGP